MKPITKTEIKEAFTQIGLKAGAVVMVHTSLSAIGYVCGGAQTVIEALTETVGTEGTIMMPTQSWKNLDPEDGVHWTVAEEDWQISVTTGLPMISGSLQPIRWGQWRKCSVPGPE